MPTIDAKPPKEPINRSFQLTIYAVGPTPEAALGSMAKAMDWGELSSLEYEKDYPSEWFVRFTADDTSMKAAGEYVTGGVIVTWWK